MDSSSRVDPARSVDPARGMNPARIEIPKRFLFQEKLHPFEPGKMFLTWLGKVTLWHKRVDPPSQVKYRVILHINRKTKDSPPNLRIFSQTLTSQPTLYQDHDPGIGCSQPDFFSNDLFPTTFSQEIFSQQDIFSI